MSNRFSIQIIVRDVINSFLDTRTKSKQASPHPSLQAASLQFGPPMRFLRLRRWPGPRLVVHFGKDVGFWDLNIVHPDSGRAEFAMSGSWRRYSRSASAKWSNVYCGRRSKHDFWDRVVSPSQLVTVRQLVGVGPKLLSGYCGQDSTRVHACPFELPIFETKRDKNQNNAPVTNCFWDQSWRTQREGQEIN